MATTEHLELGSGRQVARLAVLRRHHRAVFAHLLLVLHVLLREAERLAVEQQRGDCVRGEGEAGELLPHLRQPVALREHATPLGGGQCGGW